ncbi:EamA family transporter [Candidatus Roizmanbacteria bacterium]|nr:EamA family transporter [Candidatus Roizmanbacteria bacterium]
MWFIYSLIGALITGVGQALVKKGQIKFTPLLDNLIATISVNVILAPLLFIWGVNLTVSKDILFYALIAGTMYATFYYIISFGNVSLMVSLINTFPVITIALAIVFLHEWPNIYQWFGILFIILGILFISREKAENEIKTKKKNWLLWGLFGALAIGIAEFVTKLATLKTDGFTFTFFVYLMYIPPLVFFMIFDKKGRKFESLKNKASVIYTLLGIFFVEAGLIAIALAYQHGFASLVSPIVATHMLVTVVVAVIFLKEKLLIIQKIGIVLNLIGISMIGALSK